MKKFINKKFIVVVLSILFISVAFNIFSSRDLEIDYPEIQGIRPTLTTYPIESYFLYIYNFFIYTVGAIALLMISIAGANYLFSFGKPEKVNDAKEKFIKTFIGTIIILISFILLNTISPYMTQLNFREPSEVPPVIDYTPPPPVNYGPIIYAPETIDLLERIEKLAKDIKRETGLIEKTAYDLRDNAEFCDCARGEAVCQ